MTFLRIFLWSMFFSTTVIAASLPENCKKLSVKGETPVFSVKERGVLILNNMTKEDLWITHPVKEAGASAGWNSKLASGNFSALVLDQKNFALNCIESTPGHEQQISCEGALAVCLWKIVKVPRNEAGTFWAAEDKSLSKLKAALMERNFVFPEETNE